MSAKTTPDFVIANHGSILLVEPRTAAAKQHLEEHCPDAQWFGGSLVVEPRYVDDLLANLEAEGFTL